MNFRKLIPWGALATALLLLSACSPHWGASTLILGGDVMLARGGTPIFAYASPWEEIAPYLARTPSALFVVNLESPLGVFPTGLELSTVEMNLCADASEIEVLVEGGIDLVTTANNHRRDCVVPDPGNTVEALNEAGIAEVHINDIVYIQDGRQNVAFLAFDGYTRDGDATGIISDIRTAHVNSDMVVVSIHWGNEYQAGPTREQEELAQQLVDAGADLVWGHHPHVLQRMEWRESSIDGHPALVMYSLGNLLTDQRMLPDAARTAMVVIRFKRSGITGIEILPLEMDAGSMLLKTVLQDATADLITERLGISALERRGVRVEVWGDE